MEIIPYSCCILYLLLVFCMTLHLREKTCTRQINDPGTLATHRGCQHSSRTLPIKVVGCMSVFCLLDPQPHTHILIVLNRYEFFFSSLDYCSFITSCPELFTAPQEYLIEMSIKQKWRPLLASKDEIVNIIFFLNKEVEVNITIVYF